MAPRPPSSPARTKPESKEENDWVLEKIGEYKQQTQPSMDERHTLLASLAAHATYAYRTGEHMQALEYFARNLAIIEGSSQTFDDPDNPLDAHRASLMYNVGACLHFLGEFDLARKYCGAAREYFNSQPHGRLYKLVFGDLNGSRVKYIDERINLLEMGETPATNKYLDGSGKTCTWDEQPKQPEPIVEPKEPEPVVTYPAWTYFSAREWRSWYRGEPCASAYATMPSDGAAVGRVV